GHPHRARRRAGAHVADRRRLRDPGQRERHPRGAPRELLNALRATERAATERAATGPGTNDMKRTILITGGSSGIGFETARLFAASGERVIICSRDATRLEAAKADLGGAVEAHELDVTDQAGVEALFEAVGPLDVLVASAGVCLQARLDDAESDAVWARTIDVNVNGVYYCLKAAARTMRDGGSIVTVTSGLGNNARAG